MKTIQLRNIKIHELSISKQGTEYTISVDYSLLDDTDKEWGRKRTTIKNFTTLQKDKLSAVLTMVGTLLKNKEL